MTTASTPAASHAQHHAERAGPAAYATTAATADAIVIGAGPAGAVAAMRLAQAGWRVIVVERSAFPRRKVCGEYLSGTNWRLLRRLGLWRRFREAAGPEIRRVTLFYDRDRPPIAPLPCAAADPLGGANNSNQGDRENQGEAWGRALSRDLLDGLLLDQARRWGACVYQPARCTAVCPEGDRWRCEAVGPDGEPLAWRSPIVVAAHGAWSRGPLPTLPAAPRASDRDLLGFKAHFAGAELPADLMPLLSFPGGYGGMVTCQQGLVSLSCCIRRGVLRGARRGGRPAGEEVLRHIERSTPAVARVLRNAQRAGDWLSAGPIRPGRRTLHRRGLFAVGNAGGECHSVVAEGISMAMQSGWIAADALLRAGGGAPVGDLSTREAAGRDYRTRWRDAFGGRLRAASLIAAWAMRPTLVRCSAPVVRACPPVLTAFARLAGKSRVICSEHFSGTTRPR